MSEAIKKLHDYLALSPSVVYPEDVLAYLPAIEAENIKLRETVKDFYLCSDETCIDCEYHDYSGNGFWCKRGIGWKKVRMRELGIEVE